MEASLGADEGLAPEAFSAHVRVRIERVTRFVICCFSFCELPDCMRVAHAVRKQRCFELLGMYPSCRLSLVGFPRLRLLVSTVTIFRLARCDIAYDDDVDGEYSGCPARLPPACGDEGPARRVCPDDEGERRDDYLQGGWLVTAVTRLPVGEEDCEGEPGDEDQPEFHTAACDRRDGGRACG